MTYARKSQPERRVFSLNFRSGKLWITFFGSGRLCCPVGVAIYVEIILRMIQGKHEFMSLTLWNQCLERLKSDLTAEQFNTWILPLHALEEDQQIRLLAPNRFVLDWVSEHFLTQINNAIGGISSKPDDIKISLEIGSRKRPLPMVETPTASPKKPRSFETPQPKQPNNKPVYSALNKTFTFDSFVEGKSNQLARAASHQVGENAGSAYNPLLIYGGVGLGKTHLMHAVGNLILEQNPHARVVYLHSERFVADMVKALQHNKINEFKKYYRTLDALLIDDIQFFAGKERSQEEFFHTFNALLEQDQQVIMTCDRYPKEVDGLEERLKSRFGWGLTVAIDPPELETRAAILMSKANVLNIEVPREVAFFIAQRIHSNVRELEGALRRVAANASFTGQSITMDFVKESLRDLLAMQDKLVTLENIKKTVAEYYKIRVADILSKRRTRSITRPRQLAMALAKELTNHSLPEIGDAFGGRDHTTVLHACKKINELKESDMKMKEDYANLLRTLST